MAILTEKQKAALQAVNDGQPIAIVHSAKLRDAGLIVTNGGHSPGYLKATITPAGINALG